jgi:hypothetical protein
MQFAVVCQRMNRGDLPRQAQVKRASKESFESDSNKGRLCALQYMFGDDMLVAPITEAASAPVNATLTKAVWLPAGTWVDWVSHFARR